MTNCTWKIKNFDNGNIILMDKSVFEVGRNSEADISCLHISVSREHASLIKTIDGLFVQDKQSSNGTYINNVRIQPLKMVQLKHDDIVSLGSKSNIRETMFLTLQIIGEPIAKEEPQGAAIAEGPQGEAIAEEPQDVAIVEEPWGVAIAEEPQGVVNGEEQAHPVVPKEEDVKLEEPIDVEENSVADVKYEPEQIGCSSGEPIVIIDLDDEENISETNVPIQNNKLPNMDQVEMDKSNVSIVLNDSLYTTNNELIIISDDEEDDEVFACSQIFQLSEKVKKEQSFVDPEDDPYIGIKRELEDLDYVDDHLLNKVPIDLDSHFSCTFDLLNQLESDAASIVSTTELNDDKSNNVDIEATNMDVDIAKGVGSCSKDDIDNLSNFASHKTENKLEDIEENKCDDKETKVERSTRYKKPPIIEPHLNKKSNTDQKKEKAKTPKRTKRPRVDKTPKPSKKRKSTNNASPCTADLKSIQNEFNRRSGSKQKEELPKEEKIAIMEKRKQKLKEISDKSNKKDNNSKSTHKNVAKVKCSKGRGNFLLEDISVPTTSTKHFSKESLPSTTKSSSVQSPILEIVPPESSTLNAVQPPVKKSIPTVANSNIIQPPVKDNLPEISSLKRIPLKKHLDDNRYRAGLFGTNKTNEMNGFKENRNGIIWQNNVNDNKIKNTRKHINTDDITKIIISWPVKWLSEQSSIVDSPPVNEHAPVKMLNYFTSFNDYANVLTPLVILELWQEIYEAFTKENRVAFQAQINHSRVVGSLLYLDCVCYMAEEDVHNNALKTHDITLIEMKCRDKEKKYQQTCFSIIQRSERVVLNNDTIINNNVAQLCGKIPHTRLVFTLVTHLKDKQLLGDKVILRLITNISSYFRLIKTIRTLEHSSIINFILKPSPSSFQIKEVKGQLQFKANLNELQKKIVLEGSSLCMREEPGMYLIKGPPGTGKSTVIVNIILQVLFLHQHTDHLILVTSSSNAAVDALLLKLGEIRDKMPVAQRKVIKMIRIGPDKSITPVVNRFKLSALAVNNLYLKYKGKSARETPDSEKYTFLRRHLGVKYNYEIKCQEDTLLKNSNIICTTLTSSLNFRLEDALKRTNRRISCCIIDEATQCTEVESLIPIQLGVEKFILVGDPQQLQATVRNGDARKLGLSRSLFARIYDNFKSLKDSPIAMLRDQYRMKPEICEFPNKTYYRGLLRSIPYIPHPIQPQIVPYLVYNITTSENDRSTSNPYLNMDEVNFIHNLLLILIEKINANCRYSIGIITPYNAQKDRILSSISSIKLHRNVSINVNTVDSFQGLENDIIIISCVRYSTNNFVQNEHRLNVAITRAKQALYIIGNYKLFKHCKPLYDIREDAKKRKICLDISDINNKDKLAKNIFKK